MKEIWKDIEGYEGIYEISSFGRLKSLARLIYRKDGFYYRKKERILKQTNKNGDYFVINLKNELGTRLTIRMHRIIAMTFIPNPENKKEVNHKDMDKQNNRVSNLEWVTPKENVKHAIEHNPNILAGINKYNIVTKRYRVYQYSLDNEFIAEYDNPEIASEKTGVCGRNICQVANKEEYKPNKTRKQAGGFIWKRNKI